MKTLLSILLLFTSISVVQEENCSRNLIRVQKVAALESLYYSMCLNEFVHYSVFDEAMKGYSKIPNKRKEILTLIDFSKPSTQKRMFVLDLKNKQVLFKTIVSHGKNSGQKYATSFSNEVGSNKSSLGLYLTDKTYNSKNGYSLRLRGLEKGINDKAMERGIVMHSAHYCTQSIINLGGVLGRSHGCPVIPEEINKEVIDIIKDGSVLYIYGDSNKLLAELQNPIHQ